MKFGDQTELLGEFLSEGVNKWPLKTKKNSQMVDELEGDDQWTILKIEMIFDTN